MKKYRNYEEGLKVRLTDPVYAKEYLSIALEEYEADRNIEAFLLALGDVVNAQGGLSKLEPQISVSLKMTDLEIYEMGLKELASQLGAAEKIRFLQQCKPSDYDYTAERHKLLANQLGIDEIVARIRRREAERKEEERIKAERVTAWRNGLLELTDIEIYELALKILMDKFDIYGFIQFFQEHFKHLNGGQSIDQAQQSLPANNTASTTPNQQIQETDPQD